MATSIKIIERREKLKRLLARGLTQEEMAKVLKVNRGTVIKDINAIKDEMIESAKGKDAEHMLLLIKSNMDAHLRELWRLYDASKNDNVKLGCLKQITTLLGETINLFQQLGFMDKASEKIQITMEEKLLYALEKARELQGSIKQR